MQRTFKTTQTLIHDGGSPSVKAPPISRASQKEAVLQQLADRIVLKECAPAGVIVNDALEILQFRGRTSPYLEPASGRASLNVLNMVREELSIALRTAIASARKKAVPVKKKNITFEHNGKRRGVHLSVIPIINSSPERNGSISSCSFHAQWTLHGAGARGGTADSLVTH